MIRLKQILVPIDFSEPSERATEYGLSLARQFNATLHLLHVIEDPVVYLPMYESYPVPTRQQFETYAQERLDNWIPESVTRGVKVETAWRHGRPDVEIVDYASDSAVDLIVIGTHGRGMAAHLLLGSIAEKVVRKAACPVLTVHAAGHQFAPSLAES
ncbi:MAG: universal stress protein [Planctomycetaceae bacterium]|jgi:nucleotide-binding universal stress UspA family protein